MGHSNYFTSNSCQVDINNISLFYTVTIESWAESTKNNHAKEYREIKRMLHRVYKRVSY